MHELTWLALKNIIRGPTLSEKDRHLCMRDKRLWRNTCQSEQCRVSRPQFPQSTHGTPGTMTPLLARKTVAFYDSGFPTEARVIRAPHIISAVRVRILLAQNRVMAEAQVPVQAAVPAAQALVQPPAAPANVDNPQQNPAPLQVLISFLVICSLDCLSFSPTRLRLVIPRGVCSYRFLRFGNTGFL